MEIKLREFYDWELEPMGVYLVPIEEFKEEIRNYHFVDDDGNGYLATKDKVSNIQISCSELAHSYSSRPILPDWATHIAWYNK